ncbi:hypothetical protein [Comamonas sp.]|uniref:hypothetical protein n=1 Tax=Comamonas sp. TaxID=34028 RepID=UPI002584DCF5|nr:hypothetical protein [Comamonas sp.]
MSAATNATQSAMTVLTVLDALCGFAEEGASNKDLAAASKLTAVVITRATQTLIAYGWCRKSEETGRFFPTAQFTRLSFKVGDSFDRGQKRMEERRQSMTSSY